MRIRQDFVVPLILCLQTCLFAEARTVGRSLERTYNSENEVRTLQRQAESVRELEIRQADLSCTLNEQGLYGEPIGSVYQVEYVYQILVEVGTRISVIRVLVLPDLDKMIAESILPSFFDCGTRRRLQSQSIEGVSWRPQDVVVESGLSCKEQVDGADCYVVKGFISVFADGFDSMQEVEDAVLPAVRESMQSDDLASASDFLVGVDYVGTGLFDLVPTFAPNTAPSPSAPSPSVPTSGTDAPNSEPTDTLAPNSEPSATLAPNLSPSTTLAPNSSPSPISAPNLAPSPISAPNLAPSPISAPNSEPSPTSTSAPNLSPSSTAGPTRSFWPTWSETEFPTSATRAPTLSPTTFAPAIPSAPVAPSPSGPVAPPTSNNSTDVEAREAKSGLDKMEWWMWLLVSVGGAALLLFCVGVLFGRSSGGPSKRAVRSDDGTDPTHIGTLSKFEQSRQEYIPPGMDSDMDAFNVSPSKHGNIEELDESQEEESTEDQEEGEFGFSYGDEDQRENDAVVEYEDEEDEDGDVRGTRRASAKDVEDDEDHFGDQEQFDNQGQFEDENMFEDAGAYEPDGDVYDDGQEYDDEGDAGDYDEYEGDAEGYDDEEGYEDEEYDEEGDDQDQQDDGPYEEEYDEEEGEYEEEDEEEEVYQQEEGELSYDEESYYTEEVEEDGQRWDSSFQVNRTNSL